jgi:hypothetical protein
MTAIAVPVPRPRQLRPTARKLVLILHVFISVSWSGVAFGQLVLAVTAATDRSLRHPAYQLMHIFDASLNIPFALLTLTTGLIVSLKTPWGLLRYRWVATKFFITVGAIIFAALVMRALIEQAGQHSADATSGGVPTVGIIIGGCVMNVVFLATTLLSILKPWGKTARGRRLSPARRELATVGSGQAEL